MLYIDPWSSRQFTYVNKRRKKRDQVRVMKEYRQLQAAVELVRTGRPEWGLACRLMSVALSDPRLSNPSQDAEELLSGFLKITQRAMVRRRSWVNIAACPCRHPSLTHHRHINPFENKVWEIHIFMKKRVHSFTEVRKSMLWLWLYNTYAYREVGK